VPRVYEAFAVNFPNGRSAKAVRVDSPGQLGGAIHALGLTSGPTLVLVGGAGGLSRPDADRLRTLFVETIAPLVEELGARVVDGATDAGVMRLMGAARSELGLGFPLIGVAAAGNVAQAGTGPGAGTAELEPNHSHFLLVAGENWGDEAPWIARLATLLADGRPSVTLLVNGGEISWADVERSLAEGRPTVAVAGSGGAADAVAAHLRGTRIDERVEPLASSGLLSAADPAAAAAALRPLLGEDRS
jgi:SLOG in TRPM, prokaryote